MARLDFVLEKPFVRCSYTEAIEIIEQLLALGRQYEVGKQERRMGMRRIAGNRNRLRTADDRFHRDPIEPDVNLWRAKIMQAHEPTRSAECLVQRGRERLGVAERVAHPLCRDRVLVVSGIADEAPAWSVGLAEEVGDRAAVEAIGSSR